MDELVQPIHGLVVNPVREGQKEHNAILLKHGVSRLFRRRYARPKSTRELAWEQMKEEQELNNDRQNS